MEKTRLNVQGMTCNHCVQTVKNSLEKISGVQSAVVTLEKGAVEIVFDPGKVKMENLKLAIQDAGYEVV